MQSKQNPADLASRGMYAKELLSNELWWHGPKFIIENSRQNIASDLQITEEDEKILCSEYRPANAARTGLKPEVMGINVEELNKHVPLIEKYSDFGKIIRVTAYVLKYFKILKEKTGAEPNVRGWLSNDELMRGLNYWIKKEQKKHFYEELNKIQQNQNVDKSSKLAGLSPFLDENGLLCVRGRLSNAEITYDEKHPIIVPNHSNLSRILSLEAHQKTMHGGTQAMLHFIRAKYWIVGAKRAVTTILKSCLPCIRYTKTNTEQIMGDLPKERVISTAPFAHCGVDYFGPVKIKRFEGRCKSIDTAYAAVFICLTTKMIHIECVSNLTTDRFLWALSRLASIYRMPTIMFSDNAKTFKGAENELNNVLETWKSPDIENFLTKNGIRWKFITPRAPNQGGIWEAAVKWAKHHMKRMLVDHKLTFEQLQTLLAKISAVLNSRPLVPLSDNPLELNYLTPAHAVIGGRLVQPLSSNFENIPMSRLTQQKALDKIQQDFWNVWRKEYMGTLQNRYRWSREEKNFEVGDLVLLKVDNIPPGTWPVARILEIYPGADDIVRSVKIRTPYNDIVRPTNKLVRIPEPKSEEK